MSGLADKFITTLTAEELSAAADEAIRMGEYLMALHNADAFIHDLHAIRALPEKEDA